MRDLRGWGAQTTLYLLVSSAQPAAAGVQAALVEELVRGGSLVDGVDDDGLPMLTTVTFGDTASVEALARCGARDDNIVFAAALGDPAVVRDHLVMKAALPTERCRLSAGPLHPRR